MSLGYLLGIDVGTTRTAAAIKRPGARPGEIEIVNLGDRSSAVPSVLYVGEDGGLLVGDAAERRAVSDPDHVVREFKRRIGDPTPLLVGGRPWAPEELSSRLVQWVVDRAGQREGAPAARIAVTHPASWGAHKKDLLGAALARHGLPVAFLAEPQAAALHYAAGERVEPGSTIAVYDFGGGTFDAAVVHKTGAAGLSGGFELLGRPEGIERLGGIDLDEAVFEHVLAGIPAAFEGLDEADPGVLSAIAALRRECREAKEALSADTEVSIPVLTPAAQGSVRLHRSEFEAMIRPSVEATVGALRRAVASAGLAPEQLTAVLLVGGSSRIPLVAQLVSEQIGRPVAVDTDPKNAIAKGAALLLAPVASPSGPQVPAPRGPAAVPVPAPTRSGGHRPAAPVAAGAAMGAGIGMGPAVGTVVGTAVGPGAGTATAGAWPGSGDPTPPTRRLAATGGYRMAPPPPPPPVRPALPAYDDDFAPAPAPAPRGRPALLVAAGAVVAAAAVIAAVFLWPRTAPVVTPTGTLGAPIGVDSTTVAPSPTAPPTTSGAPAPTAGSGGQAPRSRAPVVVAPTPSRAPVTSAPAPTTQPTTAPPTTAPPTTTPAPTTAPVPTTVPAPPPAP